RLPTGHCRGEISVTPRAKRVSGGIAICSHARQKRTRRIHRWCSLATVVLLITVSACATPQGHPATSVQSSVQGVAASRLARLARCADITRWFWQVSDATERHYLTYMRDSDLDLLHRLGFTCVRLSIEPGSLYQKATPTAPDHVMLGYIDTAVNR